VTSARTTTTCTTTTRITSTGIRLIGTALASGHPDPETLATLNRRKSNHPRHPNRVRSTDSSRRLKSLRPRPHDIDHAKASPNAKSSDAFPINPGQLIPRTPPTPANPTHLQPAPHEPYNYSLTSGNGYYVIYRRLESVRLLSVVSLLDWQLLSELGGLG
jgi:hypothetical protein